MVEQSRVLRQPYDALPVRLATHLGGQCACAHRAQGERRHEAPVRLHRVQQQHRDALRALGRQHDRGAKLPSLFQQAGELLGERR